MIGQYDYFSIDFTMLSSSKAIYLANPVYHTDINTYTLKQYKLVNEHKISFLITFL